MEVFKSNLQGGLPPALGSSNLQTFRVEAGAETAESRDLGLKSPKYQVSEISLGGSEFTSVGGPAWTETQEALHQPAEPPPAWGS